MGDLLLGQGAPVGQEDEAEVVVHVAVAMVGSKGRNYSDGWGFHGGHGGARRSHSSRVEGEQIVSQREVSASGIAGRGSSGAWRGRRRASSMVGAQPAHGGRMDISPSMWRATKWPAWDTVLGQLWAELDPRPKCKIEAHELLYNIYLGAMVIRVVD